MGSWKGEVITSLKSIICSREMCSHIVGKGKLAGCCQLGYESSSFINVGYFSYSGGISLVWLESALSKGYR